MYAEPRQIICQSMQSIFTAAKTFAGGYQVVGCCCECCVFAKSTQESIGLAPGALSFPVLRPPKLTQTSASWGRARWPHHPAHCLALLNMKRTHVVRNKHRFQKEKIYKPAKCLLHVCRYGLTTENTTRKQNLTASDHISDAGRVLNDAYRQSGRHAACTVFTCFTQYSEIQHTRRTCFIFAFSSSVGMAATAWKNSMAQMTTHDVERTIVLVGDELSTWLRDGEGCWSVLSFSVKTLKCEAQLSTQLSIWIGS